MYGFKFQTENGRWFLLDEISPAIFLENIYIQGSGTKKIDRSYPELKGVCEVFATLRSANMDNPTNSGPNISITNPNAETISITISPSISGANAFYHLSIYARSIL
ncbi:TPA: hypothetical protein ACGF19_003646 [Vibrio cholerae]